VPHVTFMGVCIYILAVANATFPLAIVLTAAFKPRWLQGRRVRDAIQRRKGLRMVA